MPNLPELPITRDDWDDQRDGERERTNVYQTQRGKKRDSPNQPSMDYPDGAIRLGDNSV